MDYGLVRPVTGSSWHFAPLSHDEFQAAVAAQRKTWEVREVEEKLSLLVGNYAEYEQELLGVALRDAYQEPDPLVMAQETQNANRRLLNLLSSCYLYLEHMPKSISGLMGRRSPLLPQWDDWKKQERLQRLGFRAMEQLRSHFQHCGFAVSALTYDGEWVESPDGSSQRKHTVKPRLNLAELEKDRDFDRRVLAELKGLGNQLDLKLLVRAYVAGIGAMHARFRDAIKNDVATWDSGVLEIIDRYRRESGEAKDTSIRAVARNDQGSFEESIYIFDFNIKRRKVLERQTASAQYLDNVLITSE